jgi:hypothetical protein
MPGSRRRKRKHQGASKPRDTYPVFQSRLPEDLGCCTAYVVTKMWSNGDVDDRVTHAKECSRSGKRTA